MDAKRELFHLIDHSLLNDIKPSVQLNGLITEGRFENRPPFTMLAALKETPQSPEWHPEGNVWNHTMLVTDLAAGHRAGACRPRVFMWAALLHDTGKAVTTRLRRGRYTAYDHDIAGERLSAEFLRAFGEDDDFVGRVSLLVRWHMQGLHFSKNGGAGMLEKAARQTDPGDLALLCLCDRLGRGGMTPEKEAAERAAVAAFERCLKATALLAAK